MKCPRKTTFSVFISTQLLLKNESREGEFSEGLK